VICNMIGAIVTRQEAGVTSEERRAGIVEHLHRAESATIDSLAELFAVSKMTIHRDLDRLEEHRVVRKSRGGATLLPSTIFEADYAYRAQLASGEKRVIARYVAEHVKRGMALLIDDSSSAAEVIPLVLDQRPLTIITNSLQAIARYCKLDGITFLSLGGSYDPICNAFFGSLAEHSVSRLRVDLALLSAAAVRGSQAYFHNSEVARLKRACLAVADRSLLLVDHTKFQKTALHLFTHLRAFDEVVSTDLLDPSIVRDLRNDRVMLTTLPYAEATGAEPVKNRTASRKETYSGARRDRKRSLQRA
jgi:DeoR/GlpR family transcriptional regulator of sugar metabolism